METNFMFSTIFYILSCLWIFLTKNKIEKKNPTPANKHNFDIFLPWKDLPVGEVASWSLLKKCIQILKSVNLKYLYFNFNNLLEFFVKPYQNSKMPMCVFFLKKIIKFFKGFDMNILANSVKFWQIPKS